MYKHTEVCNLPIALVDFRSNENLIKSCRTSHSEILPPDDQHLHVSKHATNTIENDLKQTQQYNHHLMTIIENLREEVMVQTGRACEFEKLLREETQKTIDFKKQLEKIQGDFDRAEELSLLTLQTSRRNIERLEGEIRKLHLQNDRLRRMSIVSVTNRNPSLLKSDFYLALSDVRFKRELNDEEQIGTNFFEYSNLTESNISKKDTYLMTTPSTYSKCIVNLESPESSSSPSNQHLNSMNSLNDPVRNKGLTEDNKVLRQRLLSMQNSHKQFQRLLIELENKQKLIEKQYEAKIQKLKIRIEVLQIGNGSRYY